MWRVPDNAGNGGDKGQIFPNQYEKLKMILDRITHFVF